MKPHYRLHYRPLPYLLGGMWHVSRNAGAIVYHWRVTGSPWTALRSAAHEPPERMSLARPLVRSQPDLEPYDPQN